jgi:mRNA interferase MazF
MAVWETALAKAKSAVKRAQVWEVDFEPQTHKEEPGKRGRPALVIQTNILNSAGHATTIVIPGTTNVYRDAQGDGYPLRVSVGKLGTMKQETDLLIDQIRTISNQRLMGDKPLAELSRAHMKRVEDALRMLTGE